MKKISSIKKKGESDIAAEYRLDYTKAKPNRFLGKIKKTNLIVSLDEDVSEFFKNSDTVNHILRTLMQAFPKGRMTNRGLR